MPSLDDRRPDERTLVTPGGRHTLRRHAGRYSAVWSTRLETRTRAATASVPYRSANQYDTPRLLDANLPGPGCTFEQGPEVTGHTTFDSDTSVLVTGGAGFIGSHIASTLADDCEVTVYDNFSSGSYENVPEPAAVVEADVRDADALSAAVAEADVVFHKAARVSVQQSVEQPTVTKQVNLDAFVDVLEAARGSDTRIVFASSAAIYGHPEYTPVDETHPKNPTSPYGLEKLAADQYARLYHDLYDVQTVALRYFNVYGPRQTAGDYSGVISIFREQARDGRPLTVNGDGRQTRDFIHVDDVVQANLLAATTEAAVGKAFNIGTGEQISINGLAETIRDVTDSDSEITHTSARPGDIRESVADVSRAADVLGFRPEYDLRTGLEAYLAA